VRPGALLLEHPASGCRRGQPGRGALLVYDICRRLEEEEQEAQQEGGAQREASGSSSSSSSEEEWVLRAYALNRPLHASVAAATGLKGLGELGQLQLFLGGPAQPGSLSVLHRFKELQGAIAVDGEEEGEGEGKGEGEGEGAHARSGLFLGGNLEAINSMLRSGRGKPCDFRVSLGHCELQLGSGGDLQLPEPHQWLVAAGSAVAGAALCSALQAPPLVASAAAAAAAGGGGAYNSARFFHQDSVWAALLSKLAQWVETSEPERGKELQAFALPLAHAAVASYAAAGWTAEDMHRLLESTAAQAAAAAGQ